MALRLTLVTSNDIHTFFARTELNESLMGKVCPSVYTLQHRNYLMEFNKLVFRVYMQVVGCALFRFESAHYLLYMDYKSILNLFRSILSQKLYVQ